MVQKFTVEAVTEAFYILEKVGATSSRTDKENYLKVAHTNEVLKTLLYECYNNFRVFNIKKIPGYQGPFNPVDRATAVANFLVLLDRLNKREVTGNAAIYEVAKLMASVDTLTAFWFGMVLQKDLKIGITEKTVNKVFKGLIPVFSCQLAEKFQDYPNLPTNYYYDVKLDGYRCLAFNRGGQVSLFTRNGNLILGYDDIERDLAKALPSGFMGDGEIMGKEKTFSSIQKSAFKKMSDKKGCYNLFDLVPISEFESGKGKTIAADRIRMLDDIADDLNAMENLFRLPYYGIYKASDGDQRVMDFFKKCRADGEEGAMIKNADAVYQLKRTKDVLKMKEMDTLDLTVIDVSEGKAGTKYEGLLGALVVDYKGYRVNVGSGYSDEQRAMFWADRNNLINRTIEVQCQEPTKNQKGGESLRFPVFIKLRDDK